MLRRNMLDDVLRNAIAAHTGRPRQLRVSPSVGESIDVELRASISWVEPISLISLDKDKPPTCQAFCGIPIVVDETLLGETVIAE